MQHKYALYIGSVQIDLENHRLCLQHLLLLKRTQVWFPTLTTVCNSSSRGPTLSFGREMNWLGVGEGRGRDVLECFLWETDQWEFTGGVVTCSGTQGLLHALKSQAYCSLYPDWIPLEPLDSSMRVCWSRSAMDSDCW